MQAVNPFNVLSIIFPSIPLLAIQAFLCVHLAHLELQNFQYHHVTLRFRP